MSDISRRKFIQDAALGSIGLGLAPGIRNKPFPTGPKQLKKNVLFIVVDDLRPVLGAYGVKEIKSPNIDQLASEGIIFKQSFAQVPVCGPSRVSFLTGLRINNSKFNMWTHDIAPDRSFTTMPGYFKEHGYYTVSLGKVFHNKNDRHQDWSEAPWRSEVPFYNGKVDWAHYNTQHLWHDNNSVNYVNHKSGRGPYYESANVAGDEYQDGKVAEKTMEKLRELKSKDHPFFLAVGFWRPHLPMNAPQKCWDMYEPARIPIADNRFRPQGLPDEVKDSTEILRYGRTGGWSASLNFHRTTRHAYYSCVSHVDRQIGKVLQTLKELHLSENTIVVFTADHGWNLGEHNFWGKHNLMYNATHVPLIIKAPGHALKSISNIVESLDIYPTLCDLTGLPRPDHLEGRSLLPLIDENKENGGHWKDSAFVIWETGRNIVTDRYSYAEWTDSDSKMLFDHALDPEENKNVVDDLKYKDVSDQLSSYLHKKFAHDFKGALRG